MKACGNFFVNKLHNRLTEQSVKTMINRYAVLPGSNMHITLHLFCHSFAALLLEEDVDIRHIQRLLGYSTITNTQIYTHAAISKQNETPIKAFTEQTPHINCKPQYKWNNANWLGFHLKNYYIDLVSFILVTPFSKKSSHST